AVSTATATMIASVTAKPKPKETTAPADAAITTMQKATKKGPSRMEFPGTGGAKVIRLRAPNFYDLPQRRKRFRAIARAAGEKDRGKPGQNQTDQAQSAPPCWLRGVFDRFARSCLCGYNRPESEPS